MKLVVMSRFETAMPPTVFEHAGAAVVRFTSETETLDPGAGSSGPSIG